MKTIWCNGTFDILHPGHIELFKIAKSLGDKLIVATDSDSKIKKAKGLNRPVNNLSFRKTLLESIKYIDVVLVFDSDEELNSLIKIYSPDVMLLGSDWEGKNIVGEEYAKEIKFLPRLVEHASSDIINKITKYENFIDR
jgi:D-beta-D-heptose 7-phosphate kinase/D-beta-D-heptose 1-phosphate adenosyltransferase|tara:strand:- start:725 stop:1141 length:417 start_codon:yes stop_codon:yes gene_type:complete